MEKLKYVVSRHSTKTWVFACSWTKHSKNNWTATIGLGKISLHIYKRT